MNKIEVKGKNLYYIDNKTAEIDLELAGPKAVIDLEDVMFAMEHKWQLYRRKVITRAVNRCILPLKRHLLDARDPNIFVVHRDGDIFNCRRENLRTIPRGHLNKYSPLAKRDLVGQGRTRPEDIPEESQQGLSYNESAPIGYHFGVFTPLEWLGDDRYRCSTPEWVMFRGKFIQTIGIMDVTLKDMYNELERRYNKNSNKFIKGHPKHDVLIDDHTLFKGKQLIADLKPETYKSAEPGPRPEPDSWYESGKYVVYHRMKLRVVDKRWIEEHLDPSFWGEGGI